MEEEKKPAGTDADIEAGKGLAWLSYLGILFLVPMFASKDNKFSQFHARQGMVLCIVWVAWWIVFGVLQSVFHGMAFPGYTPVGVLLGEVIGPQQPWYALYWIFGLILGLGLLFLWILAIIGIIKSATGKYWRMPIFGAFVKGDYPV